MRSACPNDGYQQGKEDRQESGLFHHDHFRLKDDVFRLIQPKWTHSSDQAERDEAKGDEAHQTEIIRQVDWSACPGFATDGQGASASGPSWEFAFITPSDEVSKRSGMARDGIFGRIPPVRTSVLNRLQKNDLGYPSVRPSDVRPIC